jgi:hypothetical protein
MTQTQVNSGIVTMTVGVEEREAKAYVKCRCEEVGKSE